MLSGPVEKSGAAVSIACLVGYAPSLCLDLFYMEACSIDHQE